MIYGIKDKKSGKYFQGFNADYSAKFGVKESAIQFSRTCAKAQAELLSVNYKNVQKQPVRL